MERMKVNPTRMMLTTLKRRLATATRGHKLMKDKRDELMKTFLEVARENGRLRQEVESGLEDVYRSFTVASAIMSRVTPCLGNIRDSSITSPDHIADATVKDR